MAQVTDDFGNVYQRGAITAIPARDWEMLSTGPLRDAFLFLGPERCHHPRRRELLQRVAEAR